MPDTPSGEICRYRPFCRGDGRGHGLSAEAGRRRSRTGTAGRSDGLTCGIGRGAQYGSREPDRWRRVRAAAGRRAPGGAHRRGRPRRGRAARGAARRRQGRSPACRPRWPSQAARFGSVRCRSFLAAARYARVCSGWSAWASYRGAGHPQRAEIQVRTSQGRGCLGP